MRRHSLSLPTSVSALVLSLSLCAGADIQYTTQTSIAQDGELKPMGTSTAFLKDGFARYESSTQIGNYKSSERTISSRAKKETITLDPNLKIYVSEPLGLSGTGGAADTSADGMAKPVAKTEQGKFVMTVGAQLLGTQKMLGYPTRHYKTSIAMDRSGCCGTGRTEMKTETWMADIKLPVLDANAKMPDWQNALAGGGNNCKVTFQRRGDVAKYDAAQKGLALKTISRNEKGEVQMVMKITKLSLAALPASTFQVPAGFKKLTRAEYDSQRQKAMMAAMMPAGTNDSDSND